MKLSYTILSFLLLFTTSCELWKGSQEKKGNLISSITQEQLYKKAKEATVMIGGKGPGTGVIIEKKGSSYYVLTSRHVVNVAPGNNIILPDNLAPDEQNLKNYEDPYKIIAYNGERYNEYEINYQEVVKDTQQDLAILKFNSNQEYKTAELATSILDKDQTVYIYGFKDCWDKTVDNKQEFNGGKIVSLNTKSEDQGYTVQYTNPTILGMSGSPVFDAAGRVVAIHGKPGRPYKDKEYEFQECKNLTDYDDNYYGNNYGIPIKKLKNSSLLAEIPVKLSFDDKSVEGEKTPSHSVENSQEESLSDSPIRFKTPGKKTDNN